MELYELRDIVCRDRECERLRRRHEQVDEDPGSLDTGEVSVPRSSKGRKIAMQKEGQDPLELLAILVCEFARVVAPEVVVLVRRGPRQVPAREFRFVLVKRAGHGSDPGRGEISRRPSQHGRHEGRARRGDCCSRHAIKARLEFVGQKVDILLDLVVAKHPSLHRLLDPRQHLGDQHGREVLLRRARDEVPERRDDDAEDLFLDRLLGEVEQERDQVVPAGGFFLERGLCS